MSGPSTLVTDYLGAGVFASRPSVSYMNSVLPTGSIGFYFATDTGNTYTIQAGGSAWTQVNGGGGGGGSNATTVGFLQPNGAQNFSGGNYCFAKVVAPYSITVNKISCMLGAAVTGANVSPFVYADNNGANTGALIESGPSVANVVQGYNAFPLSTGVNMTKGGVYWIGILVAGSGINIAGSAQLNAGYAGSSGASTPASTGPGGGIGGSYLLWGET